MPRPRPTVTGPTELRSVSPKVQKVMMYDQKQPTELNKFIQQENLPMSTVDASLATLIAGRDFSSETV